MVPRRYGGAGYNAGPIEHAAEPLRRGRSGIPLTKRNSTIPDWKVRKKNPPVGEWSVVNGHHNKMQGHTAEWWINELGHQVGFICFIIITFFVCIGKPPERVFHNMTHVLFPAASQGVGRLE